MIGDYWDHSNRYEAIVCVANSWVIPAVPWSWGLRIALDFRNRYKAIPRDWSWRVQRLQNERPTEGPLVLVSLLPGQVLGPSYAICFQTKRHWKKPASLPLICSSMEKLGEVIFRLGLQSVLMPKPDCGQGGLSWPQVRKALQQ